MALTNILPDPTHPINAAGQSDVGGTIGPGFKSVKLGSTEKMMSFKTGSRRQEKDAGYHHKWTVDISYNPLECNEFHLIYSFINYRVSTLTPFFVSVPPYSSQVLAGITADTSASKGDSVMLVDGTGTAVGNLFNVVGSTKIYQVVRVETETLFETDPGVGKERIHFVPPLTRDVEAAAPLNFTDPLIYVFPTGTASSYSINKDGLFNFSVALEEVTK